MRVPPLNLKRWATGLSATTVVLAILVVSLGAVGVRLAAHDWRPSFFIVAGDEYVDPRTVPGDILVRANSSGYDGQFEYRLALDPATSRRVDFGITLDDPSYRQQRILYPALAWLFALGGRASLLPWVMIALNVAGLVALAWTGTRLVKHFQLPPVTGGALALSPALAVSLARDLTEILGVALMALGLLAVREQASGAMSGGILALAGLARETTLVVPACLAAVWLGRRVHASWVATAPPPPATAFLLPLGVASAWQWALWARWGEAPMLEGGATVGLPFVGVVTAVRRQIETGDAVTLGTLVLVAPALLLIVLALLRLPKSGAPHHERAALVILSVAMFSLQAPVWVEAAGAVRVSAEAVCLATIVILSSRQVPTVALGLLVVGWASASVAHTLLL